VWIGPPAAASEMAVPGPPGRNLWDRFSPQSPSCERSASLTTSTGCELRLRHSGCEAECCRRAPLASRRPPARPRRESGKWAWRVDLASSFWRRDGPQNTSPKGGGLCPPTFWKGFRGPRGRQISKMHPNESGQIAFSYPGSQSRSSGAVPPCIRQERPLPPRTPRSTMILLNLWPGRHDNLINHRTQ
jgi:hypothetical protein